jgi:hypothetical protein
MTAQARHQLVPGLRHVRRDGIAGMLRDYQAARCSPASVAPRDPTRARRGCRSYRPAATAPGLPAFPRKRLVKSCTKRFPRKRGRACRQDCDLAACPVRGRSGRGNAERQVVRSAADPGLARSSGFNGWAICPPLPGRAIVMACIWPRRAEGTAVLGRLSLTGPSLAARDVETIS